MMFQKRPTRVKNYQRTELDGRSFHSKLEAQRYMELRLLEKAGRIRDLECQVHVKIPISKIWTVQLIPDFHYFDCEIAEALYEEVKGYETEIWSKLKYPAWKSFGPEKLRISKGTRSNIFIAEEIQPIEPRKNK